MDSLADFMLNATNYILHLLSLYILQVIFKVRFRKAKIEQNLFQKVPILVQKAPNLGGFKKHLEINQKI